MRVVRPMPNLSLHPSARQEYIDAVDWYQQRSQASADRFVSEVEHVLAQLGVNPARYGWYDDLHREAVLRRYPYSVVYQVDPSGDVLVVAIAHASREPGYWQGRTSP